jgi:hypothetical protein
MTTASTAPDSWAWIAAPRHGSCAGQPSGVQACGPQPIDDGADLDPWGPPQHSCIGATSPRPPSAPTHRRGLRLSPCARGRAAGCVTARLGLPSRTASPGFNVAKGLFRSAPYWARSIPCQKRLHQRCGGPERRGPDQRRSVVSSRSPWAERVAQTCRQPERRGAGVIMGELDSVMFRQGLAPAVKVLPAPGVKVSARTERHGNDVGAARS